MERARRGRIPAPWAIGLAIGLALLPVAFLLDRPLAAALRLDAAPWLLYVMRRVTWLGYGALDVAVALGIGLAAREAGGSRAWRRGIGGGAAVAAAGLLDQLVKNVLCRARPNAADAGAFFSGFPCFPAPYALASFPSGHAATAFALAAVLSRWYPRWSGVWLGLAVAVGWSRIVLGSHFPSDVLGGAVLGVAVALTFVRWWPRIGGNPPERGVRP